MRAPHPPRWLYSRWVRRARTALAVLLLALAVVGAASRPPPPTRSDPTATTAVLVAAKDIAGGAVLAPADVRAASLPAGAVPDGALSSIAAAIGRMLAGPVRRGEPLTDARLVGASLARLAGGPGTVAVPVRLADPGVARLLRPGDRVDVVSVSQAGEGTVVVASAPVLALPGAAGDFADSTVEGALVVLAVPDYLAARLSSAALSTRLTVTLRPP